MSEWDDLARADLVRSDPAALQALVEERWSRVIPVKYRGARIDSVADPVREELDTWAACGANWNVVITGPVGTGKTYAACATARVRFDMGDTVMFRSTGLLLESLRPDRDGRIEDYIEPEVLVLDDLGSEKPTDWTRERLDIIVNERWSQERPIIVTTNYQPRALREFLDERLWSRLTANALSLRIGGADRRQP